VLLQHTADGPLDDVGQLQAACLQVSSSGSWMFLNVPPHNTQHKTCQLPGSFRSFFTSRMVNLTNLQIDKIKNVPPKSAVWTSNENIQKQIRPLKLTLNQM
jgi:hypothetical protein